MGRKVQMRISYHDDAAYLMRLTQAVEKDPRQTSQWRKDVTSFLQRTIVLFLEAERTLQSKKA